MCVYIFMCVCVCVYRVHVCVDGKWNFSLYTVENEKHDALGMEDADRFADQIDQ